jgi:hypothetical protein
MWAIHWISTDLKLMVLLLMELNRWGTRMLKEGIKQKKIRKINY